MTTKKSYRYYLDENSFNYTCTYADSHLYIFCAYSYILCICTCSYILELKQVLKSIGINTTKVIFINKQLVLITVKMKNI